MAEWITNTMNSLGYWGIGLLMFLENLFPPIPSELIMPLAGFTVAQGKLSFVPAVLAGVIGTILGAFPWYYLGAVFDEQRLSDLADKYGKWLTISSKDIEKANKWFQTHGGKAVLLCRLVPGVRTIISLPAGMNKMPLIPFVIYSTIGTTIWILILTSLGYFLGDKYELVDQYLAPVSKIALLIIVLFVAIYLIRKQMRRQS